MHDFFPFRQMSRVATRTQTGFLTFFAYQQNSRTTHANSFRNNDMNACCALPSSSIVLADLRAPHSLHCDRLQLCSQISKPPHSLHCDHLRLCSHIREPPHSLHFERTRLCGHLYIFFLLTGVDMCQRMMGLLITCT